MSDNHDDDQRIHTPSLWHQNHGNLLLIVIGLIFLVGAAILSYQQTRFRKPKFPDKRAFDQPRGIGTSPAIEGAETSLVISIMGAANPKGSIMVAVYDSEKDFNKPSKAIMKQSLTIKDGQASCIVPLGDLPRRLAVAAFHDENGDGELNRSRIGIPTERYGFSQNARGLVGPPSFDEAALDRPKKGTMIEIVIR